MEKIVEKTNISTPSSSLRRMISVALRPSEQTQGNLEPEPNPQIKRLRPLPLPEEDSSTVCSPSTPGQTKFNTTITNSQAGLFENNEESASHCSRPSTPPSRWYTAGISESMAQNIEKVIRLLWNRDDMMVCLPYSPYTRDYLSTRRDSLKYINRYVMSLESSPDDLWPIILAGIFLAFKSADYIPGKGRVRMNQLLDAFDRTTANRVDDFFIQAICRIEMKMMCQCDFRFD